MRSRTDKTQKQIIGELRQMGYSVLPVSSFGIGFDIIVGAHGENYLFELKNKSDPSSRKKLTKNESAFFASWNGQVSVVETTEEILSIMAGLAAKF